MIDDLSLELELVKQVALAESSASYRPGESAFIQFYTQAYVRLLPGGVLYDDVREAALEAAWRSPLCVDDDARLPSIAAHFFLLEMELPSKTVFREGGVEVLHRDFLRETLDKLPEKEDDELVASMEQLFGSRIGEFGKMTSDRHKRLARILACLRFYLQTVLNDDLAAKSGAFLAIAHTGIGFSMEGAEVIQYLNQFARKA